MDCWTFAFRHFGFICCRELISIHHHHVVFFFMLLLGYTSSGFETPRETSRSKHGIETARPWTSDMHLGLRGHMFQHLPPALLPPDRTCSHGLGLPSPRKACAQPCSWAGICLSLPHTRCASTRRHSTKRGSKHATCDLSAHALAWADWSSESATIGDHGGTAFWAWPGLTCHGQACPG